jgi:NADH-quinone oxidoreductase subunit E
MMQFSPERKKRFDQLITRYETKRSALLPTLYLAQEEWGFVSKEAMGYVAGLLEIPEAYVVEAVTFYTMFKKKDMGKHCLQVCNNITCTLMGSEEIIAAIKEEIGIGLHEMTDDNTFSLIPVQCLGSCDTAPVVQIDDDYFENQKPESIKDLIRKLKSGTKVTPPGQEALS